MTRRGLISPTTRREVRRRGGALATAATRRLEGQHSWYPGLSAKERSWVALVAQAGITNFIEWLDGLSPPDPVGTFGAAPRELTRRISLAQTLELVRTVVDVVEEHVDTLARPGDVAALREAVLRYSREIAFGAAEVYAQAAEQRGAWDARLESLVVDAVLRGEVDDAMLSQAAALAWEGVSDVLVLVGDAPRPADPEAAGPAPDPAGVLASLHRAAARTQLSLLAGIHGGRLVAVLGGVRDPSAQCAELAEHFGPGPLVHGPVVADLTDGARSAAAALSGHHAAAGWPARPHPCGADELLAERALVGDEQARERLVEQVEVPLRPHPTLRATALAHLDSRAGLEGTARALFVHVNTVRYRLRRITEVTGLDLTDPHEAFTARVALTLGGLLEGSSKL